MHACENIEQPSAEHVTERRGARYTFINPNITLTQTEQALGGLEPPLGYASNNDTTAAISDTFGFAGNTILIQREGIYRVETFTEFTSPPNPTDYFGTRTVETAGLGFTRRLWQFKRFGAIPELADSIAGILIVPPSFTAQIEVRAMIQRRPSATLARVYSEVFIERLDSLTHGQPIP